MRLKFDRNDPNAFRCCLCCHVRTGTILLGLWHLMLHILVLSLFAVVVMHPELVKIQESPTESSNPNLYSDGYSYDNYNWFKDRRWTNEDKFIGLLITFCSFLITVLLVYGAAKGRPGYLMPFFCLQVFDFCLSCLTIVGYLSYMPDIKRWITEQDNLPFKSDLLHMDSQWLMLVVVTFFVIIMTLKVYFIGVVWACYKYLTHKNLSNSVSHFLDHDGDEAAEMLLPPKYEDAIKMEASPPPPEYTPR